MVPLIDWMQEHILPELTAEDVNSNPIIKADCIRFISTFRRHLPPEMYPELFNILERLLSANSVVVHTYAACTIDRMMNVRDHGQRRLLFFPSLLFVFFGSVLFCGFCLLTCLAHVQDQQGIAGRAPGEPADGAL